MIKTILSYIVCLLFLPTISWAGQDLTEKELLELMGELRSYYTDNGTIYQEIDYRLYSSHEGSNLHSQESGRFIYSANAMYSELRPIKSFSNEEMSISIDDDRQALILSDGTSPLSMLPMEAYKEYIQFMKDLTQETIDPQHAFISYSIEIGEVSKVEMHYNPLDHRLLKIVSFYRDEMVLDEEAEESAAPRLEIVYTRSDTHSSNRPEILMSSYLQIRNQEVILNQRFSDHQLIDSRTSVMLNQNDSGR